MVIILLTLALCTGDSFGNAPLVIDSFFSNPINNIINKYKVGDFGDELYYLASGGEWGGHGSIAISISDDIATLTFYQNSGRYRTRQLSTEKISEFKRFIKDKKIDSLKDWDTHMVMDGIEYQYLHCTNKKTTSFYINNPRLLDTDDVGEVYAELVLQFFHLTEEGTFDTHYQMDDIRILIPNEVYKVKAVWKNENDFRVLIDIGSNGNAVLEWRSFDGSHVGEKISEPPDFTYQNAWSDIPDQKPVSSKDDLVPLGHYQLDKHLNNYPWMVKWNDYFVRSLFSYDTKTNGLWLTREGQEPILLTVGTYAQPVVIPNTDWVVCAKAEQGWAQPNHLVRVNMSTREEIALDISPADHLKPVVCMDGKLLISRSQNYSQERYFYDISTDSMEQISGDFDGLFDLRGRFLQATDKPNVYYAVQSQSQHDSFVGTIDVKKLKFTTLKVYRDIHFDSMSMWVDANERKLYVVKNEDLLEMPFR